MLHLHTLHLSAEDKVLRRSTMDLAVLSGRASSVGFWWAPAVSRILADYERMPFMVKRQRKTQCIGFRATSTVLTNRHALSVTSNNCGSNTDWRLLNRTLFQPYLCRGYLYPYFPEIVAPRSSLQGFPCFLRRYWHDRSTAAKPTVSAVDQRIWGTVSFIGSDLDTVPSVELR